MKDKHLLSLKDMNRLDMLEQLLDAGVTSLKIEGRLKDVAYVKNVTAAYSQRLDAILKRRKEYVRASSARADWTSVRSRRRASAADSHTTFWREGERISLRSTRPNHWARPWVR